MDSNYIKTHKMSAMPREGIPTIRCEREEWRAESNCYDKWEFRELIIIHAADFFIITKVNNTDTWYVNWQSYKERRLSFRELYIKHKRFHRGVVRFDKIIVLFPSLSHIAGIHVFAYTAWSVIHLEIIYTTELKRRRTIRFSPPVISELEITEVA